MTGVSLGSCSMSLHCKQNTCPSVQPTARETPAVFACTVVKDNVKETVAQSRDVV